MTDAELIAQLRAKKQKGNRFDSLEYEAADRIEQFVATNEALSISNATLIAERDEAFGEWDKAIVLAEKAAALMNEMDTRRIVAEAKLAKVVEALELIVADSTWDQTYMKCRKALAEIKGESHE